MFLGQYLCTDVASRSRAQKSFVNVVTLWEVWEVEMRVEEWRNTGQTMA
jgi:hypothetical protein